MFLSPRRVPGALESSDNAQNGPGQAAPSRLPCPLPCWPCPGLQPPVSVGIFSIIAWLAHPGRGVVVGAASCPWRSFRNPSRLSRLSFLRASPNLWPCQAWFWSYRDLSALSSLLPRPQHPSPGWLCNPGVHTSQLTSGGWMNKPSSIRIHFQSQQLWIYWARYCLCSFSRRP